MSTTLLFQVQLVGGYVAWLLCFGAWILPWLKGMDRLQGHRVIAALHSFRFFGLVFILPGVVGRLPPGFATAAAYGDFATGVLAMAALAAVRVRPLFWLLVAAFNLVGTADLLVDYADAIRLGLPERAGELGAAYAIPILYVPLLMITHVTALWWLVRATRAEAPLTAPATAGSR
ncbi:MAG: hypothetical protein ACXU82_10500 [Caulobacteraceae bacterium]